MVALAAMFATEAKPQTSGRAYRTWRRVEPLRPGITDSQVFAELATHDSALGNKPSNRSNR
jgi:hypothetical protein